MLELLKVLRDNGTLNEQAYTSLRKAAEAEAKTCPPGATMQAEETPKPQAQKPAQPASDERGMPTVVTTDSLQMRLGGRLQVDAASYHKQSGVDFGDGAEIRRIRLELTGTVGPDWAFRTSVEFADGADLKTAYFRYLGWTGNELFIGKHREPILLNENTSSKYTTFMERAMITEMYPGRNVGVAWKHRGANWMGQVGVYTADVDEAADDQFALTGRAVWAPIRSKTDVLHFGIAGSLRDVPSGGELRFRARPESHVTDIRLIDTGTLTGVSTHRMLGLEAAWVHGPWSVQAEYLDNWLGRDGMPTLRFGGWYAFASWFVTGESRRYRPERGVFGRVKPKRPLDGGGFGAFELAARFSRLDLTDEEIIGGREDNLTFGLNWYPTAHTRFSLNYVKVLDVDRPGNPNDGVEPGIIQMRGQVDF